VWIEVYFDPELDMRWHVTQWFFKGQFNPSHARHHTLAISFENVRDATVQGVAQRDHWYREGYRRVNLRLTVTPKHEDMVTAVIRDRTPEQPERKRHGFAPTNDQSSPLGKSASTGMRYDGRRGD